MCRFFRRPRADNSVVGGGTWLKFELIKGFIHVLDTCKNEEDLFKKKATVFLLLGIFRHSRAANSTAHDCMNMAEFRTHSRLYGCPRYPLDSEDTEQTG